MHPLFILILVLTTILYPPHDVRVILNQLIAIEEHYVPPIFALAPSYLPVFFGNPKPVHPSNTNRFSPPLDLILCKKAARPSTDEDPQANDDPQPRRAKTTDFRDGGPYVVMTGIRQRCRRCGRMKGLILDKEGGIVAEDEHEKMKENYKAGKTQKEDDMEKDNKEAKEAGVNEDCVGCRDELQYYFDCGWSS